MYFGFERPRMSDNMGVEGLDLGWGYWIFWDILIFIIPCLASGLHFYFQVYILIFFVWSSFRFCQIIVSSTVSSQNCNLDFPSLCSFYQPGFLHCFYLTYIFPLNTYFSCLLSSAHSSVQCSGPFLAIGRLPQVSFNLSQFSLVSSASVSTPFDPLNSPVAPQPPSLISSGSRPQWSRSGSLPCVAALFGFDRHIVCLASAWLSLRLHLCWYLVMRFQVPFNSLGMP